MEVPACSCVSVRVRVDHDTGSVNGCGIAESFVRELLEEKRSVDVLH